MATLRALGHTCVPPDPTAVLGGGNGTHFWIRRSELCVTAIGQRVM